MSPLSISLLGPPHLALDNNPVKIPTSRAVPLIAYLALSQQPQTRETLANLLWSDSPPNQAMAALRTTLWRLKGAGLEDWIVWDRNEVSLNHLKSIDVDVLIFQALLDKCNTHGHLSSNICMFCTTLLIDAVELYRGEFMKGFNISRAITFDDWRMQQSETLEAQYLSALERLVRCYRTYGDNNLAIKYARMWLNIDRLNENAHLQLLQLYSITGQRTTGIKLYKQYKDLLDRELNLEPMEEVTALYKQLVSGRSGPALKPRIKSPIFLLANLERPALYWAGAGVNKEQILSMLASIFKDTARRFGGVVLQRVEDSFTLLFENGQPLHFTISLHSMLKKMNWGTSGQPNLRMVLFATIMDENNPDNFASLTQMASALLSMSWGGQVVFTDHTIRYLDLPSGSHIKDLGFHFLDEIEGSAHVFELVHPNLPSPNHPPLLSPTQQRFNFPVLDTPFLGRETELEELNSKMRSPANRLISLIGPGGVGKTRLAIQYASQAAEYFPDGIYFVSFASIEDPNYIPVLLADILKFSFYGPTDFNEQLAKYLHRMKILLIIDNIEHLKLEGAKFLAFLLANSHFIKILVTSRERLNLLSEVLLEIRGFPVPDLVSTENAGQYSSIKLFLQNAQKINPRFVNQYSLDGVVRICQIVDGLPLGILLASSWVRVFSCAEIAEEISKNIDFLSSSAPDLDPRHHSLIAVFDNSWKLLSEEERRIIRRLSIFQSAFTVNAAQEICGATPLTLSVIVDKSVLYQQPDGRFMMLATFKRYASAKLEASPDEFAVTREKFVEFYTEYCAQKHPELNSLIQSKALNEMNSEFENIRFAWKLMIDSDRWDLIDKSKDSILAYVVMLGNFNLGGEIFGSALSKLKILNLPGLELLRTSMQQFSAWMAFRNGFIIDALRDLNECLEIFRQYHAAWELAMTYYYLAEAHRGMGHMHQAKTLIEEAIHRMRDDAIHESNYVSGMIAHCQSTLGLILISLDEYEQAEINLSISLATHHKIGTNYGLIQPLMGLGRLAFLQGEFLHARDLYLQVLETSISTYDHRAMAQLHNNLSGTYEAIINIPQSQYHLETALKHCGDTGDRRLYAIILNNLAYQNWRYLKKPQDAIRIYHDSLAIFTELDDLSGITYTSYDVSKAYLQVGLQAEAWNYCLRALSTAKKVDHLPLLLHALHGFAFHFANTRQPERALGLCYLLINQPYIEPETRMRVIVTLSTLETTLSPESVQSAKKWAETSLVQIVIEQLLGEKSPSPQVNR